MTQDRYAHVEFRKLVLHTVSIIQRTAFGALRHNDDTRLLRLTDAAAHECCQLVDVRRFLRNDSSLGTTGYGAVLCQEPGIAAHHLDEEDALVGVGGVADAVHAVHDGVHCGVVAYRSVGAVKVVVYGARQSYAWEVELYAEVPCTRQRPVASDDNQCVNLFFLTGLIGFLHAFRCHEVLRAGSLQYGAAPGDYSAHVLGGEGLHLTLDESVVATINALDFETIVDACARNGADSCVHARGVAAGSQDTDSFNLAHSRNI